MDHQRIDLRYAFVGHAALARTLGRFGMTESDRLRSRIHVSPRYWEASGSPSVGARCPAVTNLYVRI